MNEKSFPSKMVSRFARSGYPTAEEIRALGLDSEMMLPFGHPAQSLRMFPAWLRAELAARFSIVSDGRVIERIEVDTNG
jgi:hypothetical protein